MEFLLREKLAVLGTLSCEVAHCDVSATLNAAVKRSVVEKAGCPTCCGISILERSAIRYRYI